MQKGARRYWKRSKMCITFPISHRRLQPNPQIRIKKPQTTRAGFCQIFHCGTSWIAPGPIRKKIVESLTRASMAKYDTVR